MCKNVGDQEHRVRNVNGGVAMALPQVEQLRQSGEPTAAYLQMRPDFAPSTAVLRPVSPAGLSSARLAESTTSNLR